VSQGLRERLPSCGSTALISQRATRPERHRSQVTSASGNEVASAGFPSGWLKGVIATFNVAALVPITALKTVTFVAPQTSC
jgi:hypothetical protein